MTQQQTPRPLLFPEHNLPRSAKNELRLGDLAGKARCATKAMTRLLQVNSLGGFLWTNEQVGIRSGDIGGFPWRHFPYQTESLGASNGGILPHPRFPLYPCKLVSLNDARFINPFLLGCSPPKSGLNPRHPKVWAWRRPPPGILTFIHLDSAICVFPAFWC